VDSSGAISVKSPLAQAAIFAVALFAWQWYTSAPDASELGSAYVQELAEIARETARKCRSGEFTSHEQMMAFPKPLTIESHKRVFDNAIELDLEAVNNRLDGAYDADEYAREWDRIAKKLGG
jgi:hypothetical protein